MKTTKLLILVIVTFVFLQSCCPLFKIDCDDCDSVQQGTELADLLLENFESTIVPDNNNSSTLYNIIHRIVNFASGIECPETVADAGSHTDRLQLIYSDNADFTNPVLVETQDEPVNQITSVNGTYNVVSEIEFTTAGFYIIDNTIDIMNDVSERDESNNNDVNGLGRSMNLPKKYDRRFIIHITDDMVSNRKDKDGKPIYISKWEIKVK